MNFKKTLKFIKLNESALKILFVFLVIIFVGQMFVKISQNQNPDTTFQSIGDEQLGTIHIVEQGENLWNIAVQYFGDGFKWKEIANENNLKDEDALAEGQKLIIPSNVKNNESPPTPSIFPTASDLNNPANTSSASTEAETYSVRPGDTLWSIAEEIYGSGYNWVDIAKVNSLKNANEIETGSKLFIPNVNSKSPTLTEKKVIETAINSENYIVQKGDNLWKIAVRAYGDGYKWTEISKANNLQNPGLILPNQTLSIPR